MPRVSVVTDSVSNLPHDIAEEHGILVAPLTIAFEGKEYRDGIGITAGEVYRRQRLGGFVPTTASPRVADFVAVYEEAAASADAIASIHPSTKLSGIVDVAREASKLVENVPIRPVATVSAAMGQGFACIEAARAAAAGADLDAVVERALEVAAKASLIFVVDTLEYLHKGGRIGGAAALLGSLLNMKPVAHLVDGEVQAYGRARSKSKAVGMMLGYLADKAGGRPIHVAVFHADVAKEAEELKSRVTSSFDCVETLVAEFSPAMGAHTGPGLLGLAFFAD
jgi:DegV family protein with EDD domain